MRCLDGLRPLLRFAVVDAVLRRLMQAGTGRLEEQLGSKDKGYVWGEARNAAGQTRSARLTTPNGYRLTVDAAVMAMKHVLEHRPEGGYYTPTRLMGPRCVEQLPGVSPIRIQ